MPERKPPRGRRTPTRAPRRTFLVVVGAEKTETAYLEGFGKHFRTATVILKEKPCSPDQLVDHARKLSLMADYDEVWCVTDVDHYERQGEKITAALAAAKRAGINVAVSNPCFEFWLLLHHAHCAAHCADCTAVERRLLKPLPKYDKNNLRIDDFLPGVHDAIARARKLPAGGNPSTNVWELVSALLEKR